MFDLLSKIPAQYDLVEMGISFPFNQWFLVFLVLLVPGLIFLSYWGIKSCRRRWQKVALLFLRSMAIIMILGLILQPHLKFADLSREKNILALLVDTSSSMNLPAGADFDGSRLQRVQKYLTAHQREIEKLSEIFTIKFYQFHASLQESSLDAILKLKKGIGIRTDLYRALSSLKNHSSRETVAAVVFSDGADTELFSRASVPTKGGNQENQSLRSLLDHILAGTKVYTLSPQFPSRMKDLSILRVKYDLFAFVHNTIEVEVEVEAAGISASQVPVTLKRGEQVITSRMVSLKTDGKEGSRGKVVFSFAPASTGKYIYSVSVPVQPGEIMADNNQRSFIIKVIRDKIRILQVAGKPTWDVKFLRSFLKNNPNIDLISFFILRTLSDVQTVPNRELSLIPFPTHELFTKQINSFDLVIFQNFNYAPYNMQIYLKNIRDFVINQGGGFVMVGGDLSFNRGRYASTYIEEILPVTLAESGEHFGWGDGKLGFEGQYKSKYSPRLTEIGRWHPVTMLAELYEDNRAVWQKMPLLEGINNVTGVKPGSSALLVHPFISHNGNNIPVIAAGEFGRGRSLAISTDSLWFYQRLGPISKNYYTRFWKNAIHWLIKDPKLSRIKASTTREYFFPSEPVPINVSTFDENYQPVQGIDLEINILTPKGKVEKQKGVTGVGGNFSFTFNPPNPGGYQVEISAHKQDLSLGKTQEVVLVKRYNREMENLKGMPELLQKIADLTGGQYIALPSGSWFDFTGVKGKAVKFDKKKILPLWNLEIFLYIIIFLLCAEWFLRRRWGYQ